MKVKFFKMQIHGNDFIFMDRGLVFETRNEIIRICDRRLGIGCDQLLYYSEDIDNKILSLDIYNADGSKAEACGNGFNCASIYFAKKNNWTDFIIESKNKKYTVHYDDNKAYISFADFIHKDLSDFDLKIIGFSDPYYVNVGNPHIVLFTEKTIEKSKVHQFGSVLSTHKNFPKGVNVNFARVISKDSIELQTWERGIGYSSSCATGSSATFFAAYIKGLVNNKVEVFSSGGKITMQMNENGTLIVEGSGEMIAEGDFFLKQSNKTIKF